MCNCANLIGESPRITEQQPCFGCGLSDAQTTCTLPISPLARQHFRHNQVASEIARSIAENCKSKVDTLNHAIHLLQSRRDSIHQLALTHLALLPPIALLPNDILLLVLQDAVGYDAPTLAQDNLWAVIAVCSRWRSLALSCPGIWSRIAVTLDGSKIVAEDFFEKNALLSCRRAFLQLSRAREVPISVYFILRSVGHYRHPSIRTFVQTFPHNFHRCRFLVLEGHCPPEWDVPVPDMAKTPSLLRDLMIGAASFQPYPPLQSGLFDNTPALDGLVIQFTRLTLSIVPQTWTKITTLFLNRCAATAADIVGFLRVAKNVERIKFCPFSLPSEYTGHNTTSIPRVESGVFLPRLHTLDVDFYDIYHGMNMPNPGPPRPEIELRMMREVVENVQAPNLENIVVHGIDVDGVHALEACISSKKASGRVSHAPISRLEIQGFAYEDPEEEEHDLITAMTRFMSQLPALDSLTIEHPSEGEVKHTNIDLMLHSLLWDGNDDNDGSAPPVGPVQAQVSGGVDPLPRNICPTLIFLTLVGVTLSADALRAIIESRIGGYHIPKDSPENDDYLAFQAEKDAERKASGKPPKQNLIWGLEFVDLEGLRFTEDATDPSKGKQVLEWIEGLQSPKGMSDRAYEVEEAEAAMADFGSSTDGSGSRR